jgi:hypothetical protein
MARSADRSSTVLDDASVTALWASVRGGVIVPGDPEYETARAVYNGMIDKRPALVARCLDAADVKTAL